MNTLPSLDESLERRLDHRQRVEERGLQGREKLVCAEDPVYWVDHYGFTYDPRRTPAVLPFDLFPKQKECLRWLQERERLEQDGLIEKSRDMGTTWLCCAYALCAWLFRPGFAAGFGSRKLELVDRRGDLDCIFEKIRFLLYSLPPWMIPARFDPAEHDNLARLVNPENEATITGEGGDNIGRGGRKTVFFLDEAAFLEHPQLVDRAISQTTRVHIDLSTPNGPGNPFAEKRFSGRLPVFTLHWRDDLRKGDAWYAEQKRRLDPVTLAQEVDIDYTASVEGITIPAAWVRAAVGLPLAASGWPVCGLDIAEGGKDRSVLVTRQGPVVQHVVDWGQANTTETAHRAREEAERRKAVVLCYDCIGVGAGVRGTFESSEKALPFVARAVNVGEAPTGTFWPDGKTSKERFLNLRAELYWILRTRFEKAYEFREKGVAHPPEEMISIPAHPQLIAELSQPLHQRTESGKIKLEGKADMARRGVKSPDFADALALSFADFGCGPWEMGRDEANKSLLADVPPGVFLS